MNSQKPSITELAAQLQQALDSTRAENEELVKRIEQAEERASMAEKRAIEIQEKLSILESLKTKEYQTVVTELFEGPSKRAARLTLVIALVSIIIGLAQTIISNRLTDNSQSESVDKLAHLLREEISEAINSQRSTQSEVPKIEQPTQPEIQQPIVSIPFADLQKNSRVEFTISHHDNKYFRVSIPPDTLKLRLSLMTVTNDADLFVSYGTPLESEKAGKKYDCKKAKSGAGMDECVIDRPRAGDWFVRVHGYKGPAQVNLRATF